MTSNSTLILLGAAFAIAVLPALRDDGHARPISQAEVVAAEEAWGAGIVSIGKAYTEGGDFRGVAAEHVHRFYGYADGPVLFKPTKAEIDQFRETEAEALSYFVGGIDAEDHGFAIQPWSRVRFENDVVAIDEDSAIAMGNYFFTDASTGEEVKVEFTMAFKRAADGHLELFAHHSSLPYHAEH